MTVLENFIYYLQRFYLSREEKCENYGQSQVPVLVSVTEPGTGDRVWYQTPVPVPVTELGTGSVSDCIGGFGTGCGTSAKYSSGWVLM